MISEAHEAGLMARGLGEPTIQRVANLRLLRRGRRVDEALRIREESLASFKVIQFAVLPLAFALSSPLTGSRASERENSEVS